MPFGYLWPDLLHEFRNFVSSSLDAFVCRDAFIDDRLQIVLDDVNDFERIRAWEGVPPHDSRDLCQRGFEVRIGVVEILERFGSFLCIGM